jgi:hypothetical protein
MTRRKTKIGKTRKKRKIGKKRKRKRGKKRRKKSPCGQLPTGHGRYFRI